MAESCSKEDLKRIVDDMIEELRECDEGAVMTTAGLVETCGYDYLKDLNLFELHDELFRAARANSITLDMSDHKEMTEGLPYNMDFIVRNKKAQIKCPLCGSTDTARYIYGYPAFTEKMKKYLDAGRWALGGCCITGIEVNGREVDLNPARRCNACGKDFGKVPVLLDYKKNLAEDYRDILTSVKFSVGDFLEGPISISITKKDDGALVEAWKLADPSLLPFERRISPAEWEKIADELYGRMYLHEWKKRFENPNVLDGVQWSLNITLTSRRKRTYSGSNKYPPYWVELGRLFGKYSGDYIRKTGFFSLA